MEKVLTDKQELFCLEYIKDLNATQAAIRSGYSEDSASSIGFENLRKPEIQKRLSGLIQARNERLEVDADYVLNRLVEIDQMDIVDILNDDGTVKSIQSWPRAWRTTLSAIDITELSNDGDQEAILKKIKWPDKVRNLELIGKHVDVSAFIDRKTIEMSINPLDAILDEIEASARGVSDEH